MKRLTVTITLEMAVPDEWELRQTSEGVEVIQMEEHRFLDLTFEPILATDIDGTWTNAADDAFVDELVEMVESENINYRVEPVH